MKLKIRYEQEFQTIELDTEATKQLWVSLSLEDEEGLSEEEREQRIQDAFVELLIKRILNALLAFRMRLMSSSTNQSITSGTVRRATLTRLRSGSAWMAEPDIFRQVRMIQGLTSWTIF